MSYDQPGAQHSSMKFAKRVMKQGAKILPKSKLTLGVSINCVVFYLPIPLTTANPPEGICIFFLEKFSVAFFFSKSNKIVWMDYF